MLPSIENTPSVAISLMRACHNHNQSLMMARWMVGDLGGPELCLQISHVTVLVSQLLRLHALIDPEI